MSLSTEGDPCLPFESYGLGFTAGEMERARQSGRATAIELGFGAYVLLPLYVAGQAPHSVAARRTLRTALLDAERRGVSVEVIDALEEPGRAAPDGVLVKPTVPSVKPESRLTIVANLREGERLRRWLELVPMDSTA